MSLLVIYLPLLHLLDALQIGILIRGYAALTQELLLLIGLLHSIFAVVSAVQIPIYMKTRSPGSITKFKKSVLLSILVTH